MYCGICGQRARSDHRYCIECGTKLESAADSVASEKHTLEVLKKFSLSGGEMMLLHERFQSVPGIAAQVRVLAATVQNLARALRATQELLEERGMWSEERYRSLLVRGMLLDHGGPGPGPWESYSYYPHTLEEHDLLRWLGLTVEEIAAFDAEASSRETLT